MSEKVYEISESSVTLVIDQVERIVDKSPYLLTATLVIDQVERMVDKSPYLLTVENDYLITQEGDFFTI
jgi:hypothetical protein